MKFPPFVFISVLVSIWVGSGCLGPRQPAGNHLPPLSLDDLVAPAEVRRQILVAEQDRPEDVWQAGGESQPAIKNASRAVREAQLAAELLLPVLPRLKEMSVTALIDSLKIQSTDETSELTGVAFRVFVGGNLAIRSELASRPGRELKRLQPREKDTRVVFPGHPDGQLTIGELIRGLLSDATSG